MIRQVLSSACVSVLRHAELSNLDGTVIIIIRSLVRPQLHRACVPAAHYAPHSASKEVTAVCMLSASWCVMAMHVTCAALRPDKYCTVLYCTVLYCTVLYCTVLYCTVHPLRA